MDASSGTNELFVGEGKTAKVDIEALDEVVAVACSDDGNRVEFDPPKIVVYAPS